LYPISIFPLDLYLAYWIVHLQPVYSEDLSKVNVIFQKNKWVKQIIPAYNYKYQKILNIDIKTNKSFIKKILETIFGFNIWENIL
jgi:AAA15 family ATPase/GTPase